MKLKLTDFSFVMKVLELCPMKSKETVVEESVTVKRVIK